MNRPADPAFAPDFAGLARAVELLVSPEARSLSAIPESLPEAGCGELAALETLAPAAIGGASRLGSPEALAHMDPPTPWITWATTLWNAALNQNLLHPATAPFAREAEARVIAWLAPLFGMSGGWMCSGSTLANLTALWAARDAGGARRVVASTDAHVSVKKAAKILGLAYETVPVDEARRLRADALPDLSDACLVLTAGTTGVGAIDDLSIGKSACWRHIDAAWAGPLRLSQTHSGKLDGIETADSVAVSAHKLFFQPKSSALVLFREPGRVTNHLGFGSTYLVTPNLGVEGSRGAIAIPLLATLMAWGQQGMAARIDRCMALASALEDRIEGDLGWILRARSDSGVVTFKKTKEPAIDVAPSVVFSTVSLDGVIWRRCAAANPNAVLAELYKDLLI